MTRSCLMTAVHISWLAAKAPVWENAALAPCSVMPPLRITTGFLAVVFLSASMKRLPSLMSSMYPAITLTVSSPAR